MWIVCQIGAREHYAIPRALHRSGELAALVTDFWVPPGSVFSRLPGGRRLRDRFHPELSDVRVVAPNGRMLAFELRQRLARRHGWPMMLERNRVFQQLACARLRSLFPEGRGQEAGDRDAAQPHDQGRGAAARTTDSGCSIPLQPAPLGTSGTARRSVPTVFSYSYAAREIFRFAKARGWETVLGQIDPGPEEERIVAEEQRKYPNLGSNWQPTPPGYWDAWREELKLADRIIVNSGWSRQCLLREGVPAEKMEVVPLVYQVGTDRRAVRLHPAERDQRRAGCDPEVIAETNDCVAFTSPRWGQVARPGLPGVALREALGGPSLPFRVLFLGQVILRKGIGRLLDAMRLLRDEPVELTLAGPSEIDPKAWAELPNVRWTGPVPRSECARIYQDADCFILPTLSDGYALTQLEALSYGLPVIASKHCGEAVEHGKNGWILDNLEPQTIAAAIRNAMHEPLADAQPPEFSLGDLGRALLDFPPHGGTAKR